MSSTPKNNNNRVASGTLLGAGVGGSLAMGVTQLYNKHIEKKHVDGLANQINKGQSHLQSFKIGDVLDKEKMQSHLNNVGDSVAQGGEHAARLAKLASNGQQAVQDHGIAGSIGGVTLGGIGALLTRKRK